MQRKIPVNTAVPDTAKSKIRKLRVFMETHVPELLP